MKWTSRSIGRLIVIGQSLKSNDGKIFFKEHIIPLARNCFGNEVPAYEIMQFCCTLFVR